MICAVIFFLVTTNFSVLCTVCFFFSSLVFNNVFTCENDEMALNPISLNDCPWQRRKGCMVVLFKLFTL